MTDAAIPRLEDLESRLGDLDGKRVLVRTDFNVPLDQDSSPAAITDDFRIRSALPTIEGASLFCRLMQAIEVDRNWLSIGEMTARERRAREHHGANHY